MNISLIDLEDFFSSKYKVKGTKGYGATGILTTNQMVTRINENNGLGSHIEERALILRDIYGLPFWFDSYRDLKLESLKSDYRTSLEETIFIRYLNNYLGNRIIIFLGTNHSITSKQLQAMKYLNSIIEDISGRLSQEIKIYLSIGYDFYQEINSLSNVILPALERSIDDGYEPAIMDANILADKPLNMDEYIKTHVITKINN